MKTNKKFSVTPEQVASRKDMAIAIACVVSAEHDPDSGASEVALIDLVSEALTMYHELGRGDVDECSESIHEELSMDIDAAQGACLKGGALWDACVAAIVRVSSVTFSS